MKKNNNKGFMMAELVIVSAVIVTTLTLLYATYSKMYIVYQERSNYYNIDASYAAKNIYTNLLKNNEFNNSNFGDINNDNFSVTLVDNSNCKKINSDFCSLLKTTYNLNSAFLVKYNSSTIENLSGTKIQKDYFKYLSTSLDYTENFSYIVIVELKDNEYFYYGNYRVR